MGPINTHDPATAAETYTVTLGWPIAIGHRYRPRGGCTCSNPTCPTPGAHPLPGALAVAARALPGSELAAAPGAALIATTAACDALVMPRRIGMATMVSLDRVAPVPCLIDSSRAFLLVLPATGRYALGGRTGSAVELRSGPQQWIALPPSNGTRWDTPPWNEQTNDPIPLLHGGDVRAHLTEALAYEAAAGRRQP
ncbi:hypothetical protein ACFWIB_14880 [Streptomyces sp. NPDC127051]|uniref:hypothetical protein n=1 Tax=Streptomyces sp. NPDC127051 TaxID=3347119 RepID=UPI0036621FEC